MSGDFQKILEKLVRSGKGMEEKIAIKCGVNASTVYRWRKGKTHPHALFVKIVERMYEREMCEQLGGQS